MKDKYIVTTYKDQVLSAYLRDDKVMQLGLEDMEESILNNIYIGKVKNILKNIQAAFIEIGSGQICYYSLQEHRGVSLKEGDELMVQVIREGVKTKAPVVTSNLNFSGKYAVLTLGKTNLGISGKIKDKLWRDEIKAAMAPYQGREYGFIIRTNSRGVSIPVILKDCEGLISLYEQVIGSGRYKTCYSCIYQAPPSYITGIRDVYDGGLKEIITDEQEYYERIRDYFSLQDSETARALRFYEDPLLSLTKLYSLETVMERALAEKVWLKSGGYLVIQPTEALTVIDVNTGKFTGKKALSETLFKINMEAAKEAAYQMRLRNLSGIIIVDFIDMKEADKLKELTETFEQYLEQDPVKTTFLGLTRLNLAEVTRKKIKKPLYEQVRR